MIMALIGLPEKKNPITYPSRLEAMTWGATMNRLNIPIITPSLSGGKAGVSIAYGIDNMLDQATPMHVMENNNPNFPATNGMLSIPRAPMARQRVCMSFGPVNLVALISTNENRKHTALYIAKQNPAQAPDDSISTVPALAWKTLFAIAGEKYTHKQNIPIQVKN